MTRPLRPYRDKRPRIAGDAFVADTAVLTGDVEIGPQASVWYGVVMRGDSATITIGERSNVQDGTIVHADEGAPVVVGNDVTIGHRAIIHGCVIEDGAQVSMGAIVLTGARVGAGAIVGAGALVPEGGVVAAGTVVMGVPAKPRRTLSEADQARIAEAARHYVALGQVYKAEQDGASA